MRSHTSRGIGIKKSCSVRSQGPMIAEWTRGHALAGMLNGRTGKLRQAGQPSAGPTVQQRCLRTRSPWTDPVPL